MILTEDPGWHWRNCREVGFSVEFWPLTWAWGFERDEDLYGGRRTLCLGPIAFTMHFNIGNCSSENRLRSAIGLSETEAYERAVAARGPRP